MTFFPSSLKHLRSLTKTSKTVSASFKFPFDSQSGKQMKSFLRTMQASFFLRFPRYILLEFDAFCVISSSISSFFRKKDFSICFFAISFALMRLLWNSKSSPWSTFWRDSSCLSLLFVLFCDLWSMVLVAPSYKQSDSKHQ